MSPSLHSPVKICGSLTRGLIVLVLWLLLAAAVRASVPAHLRHDVTVGAEDHPVHLKAGNNVELISQTGAKAVIMVTLPTGDKGIYQVSADAVEPVPAVAPPPMKAPPPPPPSPAVVPASTNVILSAPVPEPAAPVNDGLTEDQIQLVQVAWPETTPLPDPYGQRYKAQSGSYSYKLYLPPGYHEHPNERYPALFIMSPNGSATIAPFQERARKEGWVVVMFVEAKNGDWGPIFGDMLATHADVTKRVRIQEGLKFGTGFSGGSRGTSMLTQICPGFSGELLNAAGFAFSDKGPYETEGVPTDRPFAVFMAMGMNDSNFSEIDKLRYSLPAGVAFKAETLAPTSSAMLEDGLDWLVQQAMGPSQIREDFRPFALRHFDYLATRVKGEPAGTRQVEGLKQLCALGDQLQLDRDPDRLPVLKNARDELFNATSGP